MKSIITYLAVIAVIIPAFASCKKSSESVNPDDIYYKRMATMRHWVGSEYGYTPTSSYSDTLSENFAVQVIDHNTIIANGAQLPLTDTSNNSLKFEAGDFYDHTTVIYTKSSGLMEYTKYEAEGLGGLAVVDLYSE